MVATGEAIPVMTRLRMALLYQQRREYEAAQDELMAMWDQRAAMTTTLQAETLFWLGEGRTCHGPHGQGPGLLPETGLAIPAGEHLVPDRHVPAPP